MKRRKKPFVLPTKASDLLELAVRDARAMAKRKGYKLNMGVWQKPNGVCQVCMAGSVMAAHGVWAKRTNAETFEEIQYLLPAGHRLLDGLFAINDLRLGYAPWLSSAAAPAMEVIRCDFDYDRDGGRAKWSTYLKAAKMLREVGL